MRVAICDDNVQDLDYYAQIMEVLAEEEAISIELINFDSGVRALFSMSHEETNVDLLLLDIHMPGLNGIETAAELRRAPYHFKGEIVFITISEQHAIEAFDVQAFHYIVKGVTSAEKVKAILRLALQRADQKRKEYILFKGIGEYRNIAISEIHYFEIHERIITVHYAQNETFEFYSSIGKLEITVLPKGFLRVHRSYIVAISKIETFNSSKITLKTGTILPVGRKFLQNVKLALHVP